MDHPSVRLTAVVLALCAPGALCDDGEKSPAVKYAVIGCPPPSFLNPPTPTVPRVHDIIDHCAFARFCALQRAMLPQRCEA